MFWNGFLAGAGVSVLTMFIIITIDSKRVAKARFEDIQKYDD